VNSSQQWDYPNCWPPLQAMVIQGLDRTNYKPAQTVAINLAKSWINTNYIGYINSGTMFEKVIVFRHSTNSVVLNLMIECFCTIKTSIYINFIQKWFLKRQRHQRLQIKVDFDSIVYFICIYSTVHSKWVRPVGVASIRLRQDLDGRTVSCSNCSGDGDTYFNLLKYHTTEPTMYSYCTYIYLRNIFVFFFPLTYLNFKLKLQ